MKILLDTIDLDEIEYYYESGIIVGVTTNPTLAKKFEMHDDIDMINKIRNVMPLGEIHVEAFGNSVKNIIDNAKRIFEKTKDNNLVFKIPFNKAGVAAAKKLKEKNYTTNLHLIFSANQALLASAVSADYICPLMGRLDDVGHDAFGNLKLIKNSYKNNNIKTKIMASSIRHPRHVQLAFEVGADIVTIPSSVLEKLYYHPLTDIGYEKFKKDIESI
jgi:transaldolase